MKISKVWILVLALIIVIIYLVQCRGNKVVEKPVTVPVEAIKNNVVKDEAAIGQVIDSMNQIVIATTWEAVKNENKLDEARSVIQNLNETNDGLLAQLKASELTTDIQKTNELIKAATKKSDSLCRTSLSNLNKTISTKNSIISQKDKLYQSLKKNLDTCLNNQTLLERYSKSVQPRNQVYAGIMYLGNVNKIFNGYGVRLGLKTKNGQMIDVGAIQISGTTNWMLSYSRTISFRK